MSRLSFKTFYIEFYSSHIQKSSDEVFLLFEQEGLLGLLEKDYEDLHGMSMEYMMQFINEYLDITLLKARSIQMEHYLIRATIIPKIVELIQEEYNLDEDTALYDFYTSATGASLADDSTGLYGQSILYIFGLYKEEREEARTS